MRGLVAQVDGTTEAGGAVYQRGMGLIEHEWFNARYVDYLEFGADSTGVRYRADGQLAAGPALRWSDSNATFLRGGIRAQVARSAGLYTSDVRLPDVQVGHRISGRRLQIDVAAHGSYVLTGRFNSPGQSQKLGDAWAFGALLSVGWEQIRLDAEWTRFQPGEDARADDVSAHLCWLWSSVMVCADGRFAGSRAGTQAAPSFDAQFIGLSLLVGQLEWI